MAKKLASDIDEKQKRRVKLALYSSSSPIKD